MLAIERSGDWVTLRLNRPEVGNALNGEVMIALRDALNEARADESVRGLILTGTGKLFSAGADLAWMKKMEAMSPEDNLRDAIASGELFNSIRDFPRPVIAAVNGAARGGGVGIIAACDFAIAASNASFAFSEVRIGVVPALISPLVIAKMGESRARRLFLTGDTFSAEQAVEWGLLDRAVPGDQLATTVAEWCANLKGCAPGATAKIKELVAAVRDSSGADVTRVTARILAEVRSSPEALEGMMSFLEKRPPSWAK